MFELFESVFSAVGVGGFAALWLLKAGAGVLVLRYLKQKRTGTSG